MATNNKFIVERTNALKTAKNLTASYSYIDDEDFGFYAKAGEVYAFEAIITYTATAGTEGAAFSINSSSALNGGVFPTWICEFNTTDATTSVRTQCIAFNTPDHGTASPNAFPTGANVCTLQGIVSVSTDGFVGVTGIAENSGQISVVAESSVLKWSRVNWPTEA